MAGSSAREATPSNLPLHTRHLEYPHNHENATLYQHETLYTTFIHTQLTRLLPRILHAIRDAPHPVHIITDSRGAHTHNTPVYNGTAGILLLLTRYHRALRRHRVHPTRQNRLPGLADITPLLTTTLHALEASLPPAHARDHRFHRGAAVFFGLPGIILTCATAHDSLAEVRPLHAHVQHLLSLAPYVASSHSVNHLNEVLYGRAGYLIALSILQHTLPTTTTAITSIRHAATTVIAPIITDGQRHARHPWPLLWYFHRKAYLGAAHGMVGILYALLTWFPLLSSTQRDAVTHTLNVLASFLTNPCPPSLDPRTAAPTTRQELIHWCHGPPGHIMLFSLALHRLPTDAHATRCYTNLIETLADRIVEKGLIRKGMGLCHGISGNCYAFLSAYRATHNERYLRLARAFYHIGATSSTFHHAVATYHDPQRDVRGVPDTPCSLMEGSAGEVCLLLDLLQPLESAFPGFECNPS